MPHSTRRHSILDEVIAKSERPLTPVEILGEARGRIPGLGIATVYRALKRFVGDGRVRLVEIPGISPRYESAARHHHHFFFCDHCRRLFDLHGCVRGIHSLSPAGFRAKRHEIVIYGDCADCRRHA